MLTIFIVLFIIAFFLMLLFALIKVGFSKSTECHNCGKKFKMLGNKVTCPFCKTKYFKNADGTYKIKD